MAAIGSIRVEYFATFGTRSLCCRSRLAIMEKETGSMKDAQFSREKLINTTRLFYEIKSLSDALKYSFHKIIPLLKRKFLIKLFHWWYFSGYCHRLVWYFLAISLYYRLQGEYLSKENAVVLASAFQKLQKDYSGREQGGWPVMKHQFIKISTVDVLDGCSLRIHFHDGAVREINLEPVL